MIPIPETARLGDPVWGVAYLELAHELVRAGAKAKLIARYTGLPLSQIRGIYRALRGRNPPSGALPQGNPRFFTQADHKHTAESWSVQTAVFLACYERVAKITATPAQRGWQLLAAFSTYLAVTQALHEQQGTKRLDLNQAYALLTHSGFLSHPRQAAIRRRKCPACLIRYAIVTNLPPRQQACPICAIHSNALRLSGQS